MSNRHGYVVENDYISDIGMVLVLEDGSIDSYELKKGESIIFDDLPVAQELQGKFPKVRYDGKKWIGEGEPIPQPAPPEPPFDALEDVLYRMAMLEIGQGQLRATEKSLQMLTSEHLQEVQEAVRMSDISVTDDVLRVLDSDSPKTRGGQP